MRLKFSLILVILGLSTMAIAQPKVISKANEAYASENYATSAKLCQDAYQKLSRKGGARAQKRKGDMAFKVAESYRHTERYKDAIDWYDRCLLLEYEQIQPEVLLYNAEMLTILRDYEKAIENYKAYLELVPGDERALAGIESCEKNKDYIADKTRHKIENEVKLNTSSFDMAPMFGDRKQSMFYFSSGRSGSTGKGTDPRSGDGFMDIWVSNVDKKGNWQEPKIVENEAINTPDNEGTVCFDSRYKTMFFTRCPSVEKQNLGCEIWMSDAKGKTDWKDPVKVELGVADSVSVGHPCTEDGKFLIFASDMPGGFGGRDLWYTTFDRKTDSWTTPVNMGPEINTKGNELFPTFALNGDLIYASDGFPGLGGLDIFRANRIGEENKWEKPKNIGAPINSEHNDYALIEQTDRLGYFTSERKSVNGENIPDIYSYELPPNLFDLKVVVSDLSESDVRIEDAVVTVTAENGDTWEGYTDANGTVFWDKKPTGDRYINEESSYTINIAKEGFYENKKPSTISTKGLKYDQQFVIEMGLFPVKKPIRLPEVRYPLNKWELLVDSTINSPDSLLFVYNLLQERPELVLELSSHTDSRGSATANQKLSENRARACYKYLVEEKGVDPRRIVPVGKGESTPRTVYLMDGKYLVKEPTEGEYETIVLTEAYINKFRRSSRETFDLLHGLNRRTEGAVRSLEFDPATAPEADPALLEYVKYP